MATVSVKPLNAFFTPREGDGLYNLIKAGESENLIWAKSDLKLDFKYTEFLDCKHFHRDTNIQARLAEHVFVHNNSLGTGLGYTSHQLVLGLSSVVPGIYDVPENDNSNFSQSLKKFKAGLNKSKVTQLPSTPPRKTNRQIRHCTSCYQKLFLLSHSIG